MPSDDAIQAANDAIALRLYSQPLDWDYEVSAETHVQARLVPQSLALPIGSAPGPHYPSLPARLLRPVIDGGVYDAHGRIERLSAHLKNPTRNVPLPRPAPAAADAQLAGDWLFGGRMSNHFGHLLTESLGRLWALDGLAPAPQGVAFLWHSQSLPARLLRRPLHEAVPLLARLFHLLGITIEARLVVAPTRVERLVVPSQLAALSNGPQVAGHPRFRDFARRLALHPSIGTQPGADRLFVSRSRLVDGEGQVVLEAWLDEVFAAAGYTVIHPEALALEAQIALYASAAELVFVEGSALHLYGLVARPEQRVGVILRRHPPMPRFANQLLLSGVRAVLAFDEVAMVIMPTLEPANAPDRWNTKYVDALIDFQSLRAKLIEAGFLPAGTAPAPSAAAMRAGLAETLARRARTFAGRRFEALPRDAVPARLQGLRRQAQAAAAAP
jgi:capsular polysaccharide biosynthesis protein